jgi:DNA-binding transcriptional MerR regulator
MPMVAMTKSPSYRISDLAQEFGVTTRTIRHYEDLGLLSPERIGQSRVYSRGDRTRLKLILRGKRLGFSLQESRDIIQMYDPSHNNRQQLQQLFDHIQQQKQRLQTQLQDIQAMLSELDNAEKDCQQALLNATS